MPTCLRPLFGGNLELPHLAHGAERLLTDQQYSPAYRIESDTRPISISEGNQGMDGNDVRRAIYFHNAYQTVLRTSIRDPHNIEPKLIIVPDLSLSEHLQQLFPGSRIERMATGIPAARRQAKVGRPRRHRNDSERKAQYRQKMKLKLMRSMLLFGWGPPLCVRGNVGWSGLWGQNSYRYYNRISSLDLLPRNHLHEQMLTNRALHHRDERGRVHRLVGTPFSPPSDREGSEPADFTGHIRPKTSQPRRVSVSRSPKYRPSPASLDGF